MSLEVKSEGDVLEFVHMKQPAREADRMHSRMLVSHVHCCVLYIWHALTLPDMDMPPSEISAWSQQEIGTRATVT